MGTNQVPFVVVVFVFVLLTLSPSVKTLAICQSFRTLWQAGNISPLVGCERERRGKEW